jgi:colanic acid biosynthesis glycosyl transferase WcaI
VRILVCGLNFYPEPTGIGKYTGELAEALCAAGHEVRVVTAPPYYPSWRVWDGYRRLWYRADNPSLNLSVIRCPLWVPANPTGLKRMLHLVSFALTSLPIVMWQRMWRPNVVIVVVPTLFCVPGALLAVVGGRSKRLVHTQDLELDAAFELGFIQNRVLRAMALRVERWLLNRFDMVSSISRRMLERLAGKGVAQEKLKLLPNWIDTEQIKPVSSDATFRKEWGLQPESVVVLYSGSLGEKQGIGTLLQAAASLENEEFIRFVICSDGPTFSRLMAAYSRLSNVIWRSLVPADRLSALLSTADIHVLPQSADAADLVMPSKLTGMLASGRPVIATAAPGTEVADVVQGKGLVAPPGDESALANAIRELASDPQLRRAFGAAGRQYAVEQLDREAILARFEKDLVALVGGQRNG